MDRIILITNVMKQILSKYVTILMKHTLLFLLWNNHFLIISGALLSNVSGQARILKKACYSESFIKHKEIKIKKESQQERSNVKPSIINFKKKRYKHLVIDILKVNELQSPRHKTFRAPGFTIYKCCANLLPRLKLTSLINRTMVTIGNDILRCEVLEHEEALEEGSDDLMDGVLDSLVPLMIWQLAHPLEVLPEGDDDMEHVQGYAELGIAWHGFPPFLLVDEDEIAWDDGCRLRKTSSMIPQIVLKLIYALSNCPLMIVKLIALIMILISNTIYVKSYL